MTQPSPDSYLENEILTATPQQLRRLLIDGAVRFAKQAQELAQGEDVAGALVALARVRAIVAELLGAIQREEPMLEQIVDSIERPSALTDTQRAEELSGLKKISQQTLGLYVFLFQELTELQVNLDLKRLADVQRVLGEEAETARLVCEQMPAAPKMLVRRDSAEVTSSQAPALGGGQATYSSPTGGAAFGGDVASRQVSFEA